MTTQQMTTTDLDTFYDQLMESGYMRTKKHARRWTTAVLKTLGFHLGRGVKKDLANALPEPMADDLTRVFWLLHFRDPDLRLDKFLNQVALRSGNTDIQFARYPTRAIFHQIKEMIDGQLADKVADDLPTAVGQLWREA